MLVPLALLLVGAAVWGFVWSVKRGDMDDLETPAVRMVFDDEPVADTAANSTRERPERLTDAEDQGASRRVPDGYRS